MRTARRSTLGARSKMSGVKDGDGVHGLLIGVMAFERHCRRSREGMTMACEFSLWSSITGA